MKQLQEEQSLERSHRTQHSPGALLVFSEGCRSTYSRAGPTRGKKAVVRMDVVFEEVAVLDYASISDKQKKTKREKHWGLN